MFDVCSKPRDLFNVFENKKRVVRITSRLAKPRYQLRTTVENILIVLLLRSHWLILLLWDVAMIRCVEKYFILAYLWRYNGLELILSCMKFRVILYSNNYVTGSSCLGFQVFAKFLKKCKVQNLAKMLEHAFWKWASWSEIVNSSIFSSAVKIAVFRINRNPCSRMCICVFYLRWRNIFWNYLKRTPNLSL